jgi:hypothetical protein
LHANNTPEGFSFVIGLVLNRTRMTRIGRIFTDLCVSIHTTTTPHHHRFPITD